MFDLSLRMDCRNTFVLPADPSITDRKQFALEEFLDGIHLVKHKAEINAVYLLLRLGKG